MNKHPLQNYYHINTNFKQMKTSSILENSFVFIKIAPGIHAITTIGLKIMDELEKKIRLLYEDANFHFLKLPTLVPNDVLKCGDAIGEKFESKFIKLNGTMKDYHLLSTDEALILNIEKQKTLNSRQFPVKTAFIGNVFRQIAKPVRTLTLRQLKIFGTYTFVRDHDQLKNIFEENDLLMKQLFDFYKLPFKKTIKNHSYEYFFPCSEGDIKIKDEKLISLAFAYKYGDGLDLPVKFKENNELTSALSMTFAIGIQRLFFSIFDYYRDKHGFNLPSNIRPYDISIIPKNIDDIKISEKIYKKMRCFSNLIIDDRCRISLRKRIEFARFIGCHKILVINKSDITEIKR